MKTFTKIIIAVIVTISITSCSSNAPAKPFNKDVSDRPFIVC